MMHGRKTRAVLMVRCLLVGFALAIWCSPVLAQGAGTAAGTTAAGSGSTSSTTTAGSSTQSSDIFGSSGTGSSGVTSTNTTGTSPIQKTNALAPYYSNPIAAGYGANVVLKPSSAVNVSSSDTSAKSLVTGKGTFGVAMFSTTAATSTSGKGGTGAGSTTSTGSAGTGFTSINIARNPAYYTRVDPRMAPPSVQPMRMQAELNGVLSQSSSLASAKNLNVTVDDAQNIVIRGVVGSADDRLLAEALVRMTPGTASQFVRNEIEVVPTKK